MDWPVRERLSLPSGGVAAKVRATCRAARMESYEGVPGRAAADLRSWGVQSAAGAPIVTEDRLWGVVVAFWTRPSTADDELLERLTGFAELVAVAIANAENRAELQASRARVVAAADETRRRIERDLHDGAQQRLVSLALDVRRVETMVPSDLAELGGRLSEVADGLVAATGDLQEISRGIHPAVLSRGGLAPALRTVARRSPIPVELELRTADRLPEPVEVTLYYVVSEALANSAKHARASVVHVVLDVHDATVTLDVRDDGVGGADPTRGSGLIGLRDRVEALGGEITVTSQAGSGTSLTVSIPLRDDR